jgi:hypothetical protein
MHLLVGPRYSTRSASVITVLLAVLILLGGCYASRQKRSLVTPDRVKHLDRDSPLLKAHMLDGNIYVLSPWRVDETRRVLSGKGSLLDVNRDTLALGTFSISLDSVAIFETNQVSSSPSVVAMSIMTGVSVAITTFCLINPKACFGSCPTFYTTDGDQSTLLAEGFSSSVAPSLEASDVDALFRAEPKGRDFDLLMKNEALETHVVRYANLLAVPRPPGGRVFATPDGRFWQVTGLVEPISCRGPEGDCLEKVRAFDGEERISLADSTFLAAKETIDLEFDDLPTGKPGLVIASRQSLLSTFLFYQGLAYMGGSVGEYMASLERGEELPTNGIQAMDRALGGIEILVCDQSDHWRLVGEVNEVGPLATNTHLIPLPDSSVTSRKIRLRFSRGRWRVDYIALAVLQKEVIPQTLYPVEVHGNRGGDDDAREILLDTSRVLVTLPGDEYVLRYRLPEGYHRYELFLKTRGYYLEWMRDEWLPEENAAMVAMMFLDPEKALHRLAPEFKQIEAQMEDQFWGSRYAR